MPIAWSLNALALAFGVILGARGLLDPKWAARLVRLKPDEQGGGFAEFRATYGGVFLGLHAAALLLSLRYMFSGEHVVGLSALGAATVLAAGWAGASVGRLIAIWRDDADTPFNRLSAVVEAVMAIAIGSPWLFWMLGA